MGEVEIFYNKALVEEAPLNATPIYKNFLTDWNTALFLLFMSCSVTYVSNALNISLLNNWYQLTAKSQLFIIY